MNVRLEAIAARRRLLIAEIAGQRQLLGVDFDPWRAPLARIDRGLEMLRLVKRHPLLMAGTVFLVISLRRGGRTRTWLGRGWVAWQVIDTYRKTRAGPHHVDIKAT